MTAPPLLLDFGGLLRRKIQFLAQFLAGLEEGHEFFLHFNGGAGARIAAGARWPAFYRKRPETAQFHAVTARERSGNFIEDGADDEIGRASCRERVCQYV